MKKVKKRMYKALSMLLLSSLLVGTISSPITLNATSVDAEELLDTRAADITPPVIEKVDFPDNGKTVNAGDKLPIYVDAFDLDSGIDYIQVSYTCSKDGANSHRTATLSESDTYKRYEGEIIVSDGGFIEGKITEIRAVDNSNRTSVFEIFQDGSYRFAFKINDDGTGNEEAEIVDVESFVFLENKQEINKGDSLNFEMMLAKEDMSRFDKISIMFNNGIDNKAYVLNIEDDKYVGEFTVEDYMKSGKWTIKEVYTYSTGKSVKFKLPDNETWFEVIGEDDIEEPIIEYIKMDKKNGEILSAGDSVNFEIKVKDNKELFDVGDLMISSSANIVGGYQSVGLEYDAIKEVFKGKFTVDKNTYPCEWYLSSLRISDKSGNSTNLYDYISKTGEEFYFNVEQEGTFVSPIYDKVSINFYGFDPLNSNWRVNQIWEKENVERRTSFKDAGVVFPETLIPLAGLKFVGWTDDNGKMYTDESQIADLSMSKEFRIWLYPVYDQDIVTVNYKYPNKNLMTLESIDKTILMPKNSTYGDAFREASKQNLNNIYSEQEYSWSPGYYSDVLENQLPPVTAKMEIQAIYPGYKVVSTPREYYNENGIRFQEDGMRFVKNGTTFETIEEELRLLETPKMFKGLRFISWNTSFEYYNGEIVEEYATIDMIAYYENCIIRFFVDDDLKNGFNNIGKSVASEASKDGMKTLSPYEQYNLAYAMVAEKGDIITIPEIPGYKNITWLSHGLTDNSLEVRRDATFYGYGDKIGDPTEPDKPVDPDKPVVPDTPSTGEPDTGAPGETTKPETPTVTNRPSAEVIEKVVSNITEAKEGETVEVNMGDATVLPVDFLASARGKNITIKLVMNGYSWSINGQDIVASSLKDINMEVTLDSNAVPSHVVKSLAGDNPIKQLSLTHNGDFGFKADLTVNVGNEHQGKYGNLYYYDSDGKMVFMNAGTINEKGEVSLSFSHASDYVVVINDKIMNNNETDVPDSGDTMNHMLWITTMMASLVVVGMMYNKKRKFIK